MMRSGGLCRTGVVWIFSMCLDMLFEILGTLECLLAVVALVWLQWDMDADVRGDVITLHGGCPAGSPGTGEVQIIGRLAANVILADVILYC
jgi:hypothetical protein